MAELLIINRVLRREVAYGDALGEKERSEGELFLGGGGVGAENLTWRLGCDERWWVFRR